MKKLALSLGLILSLSVSVTTFAHSLKAATTITCPGDGEDGQKDGKKCCKKKGKACHKEDEAHKACCKKDSKKACAKEMEMKDGKACNKAEGKKCCKAKAQSAEPAVEPAK